METRNTIQRQLVLDAVQAVHTHPTAETIYNEVAKRHPAISRGTVYRNLAVLEKQGKVQRVAHPATADRFDFNLAPHYHFHCRGCGGVFDSPMAYSPDMLDEVQGEDGFLYESYDIIFSGLCPECR